MNTETHSSGTSSPGLTIPAAVLQLPVPVTAKVVLAEVLALNAPTVAVHERHFMRRLGLSQETVRRAFRQLHEAGCLAYEPAPARRHWLLRPTLPTGDSPAPEGGCVLVAHRGGQYPAAQLTEVPTAPVPPFPAA